MLNSGHYNIQGVLLPDLQTLRGDSRHEEKRYTTENQETQTSSVGARGHKRLMSKTSNNDKKQKKKKKSIRMWFSLKSFFISRFASKMFLRVTSKNVDRGRFIF